MKLDFTGKRDCFLCFSIINHLIRRHCVLECLLSVSSPACQKKPDTMMETEAMLSYEKNGFLVFIL